MAEAKKEAAVMSGRVEITFKKTYYTKRGISLMGSKGDKVIVPISKQLKEIEASDESPISIGEELTLEEFKARKEAKTLVVKAETADE